MRELGHGRDERIEDRIPGSSSAGSESSRSRFLSGGDSELSAKGSSSEIRPGDPSRYCRRWR